MTINADVIANRFSPWSGIPMWVLCDPEKRPTNANGSPLQWKVNPGDGINTLDIILGRVKDNFGVGPILGLKNHLICYDFDHSLDDNGAIINPAVMEFIEILGTFVEISSSGKGLHAFVAADIPDDTAITEYGFKSNFCDGKCYPARFIKLTGNCLPGYDLPIQTLSKGELDVIERKISAVSTLPKFHKARDASQNALSNGTGWDEILGEAGILHLRSQYFGKTRVYPGGVSRTATESYRIPCPNRFAHTGYRKRQSQFGPDCAILTRWDDGSSSCTCNHNACDPASKPNLLQKLWDEIRANRLRNARMIIETYKEVLV